MTRRYEDDAEIGGRDPLDQVPETAVLDWWLPRLSRRLRTQAAFGLAPVVAPAMLFVPVGALLGPLVLNVLRPVALGVLDPVISVASATLGVFVGLGLARNSHLERRLLVAASVESGVTVLVVFGAIAFLLSRWEMPLTVLPVILALVLAVPASASSAGYEDTSPSEGPSIAARLADLDDVLPIVVGGAVVPALVHPELATAIAMAALTAALGLAVGIIGWLLIGRSHSAAERGAFIAGSLALAGGVSAYLGLSPLLGGLATGAFWSRSPGRTSALVQRELRKYQHPLVVLMLLAAGASLVPSLEAVWLFAPFVMFRLTGKLAGGWLATRLTPGIATAGLGAHLLAPGLLGVAFVFTVHQVLRSHTSAALLTAVVAGTLVSEIVALVAVPTGRAASVSGNAR
jgi:hypothetical protein